MQSNREVASGVVNLGSTCYMNAVLQALAHAPELCSAIECESHYKHCPIASSNLQRRLKKKASSSTSTTSSSTSSGAAGSRSNEGNTKETSNNSSSKTKRRKANKNSNSNLKGCDNDEEFCLLCEIEKHLIRVHNSGLLEEEKEYDGDNSNGNSSNGNRNGNRNRNGGNGPVAPSDFVNGFITHVAPWFKLGVQEDSHEFLRLLIDAMQKSCNKIKKGDYDTDNKNLRIKTKQDDENDNGTNRIDNITKEEKEEDEIQPQQDQQPKQKLDHEGNEYAFRLFRGKVESIVNCSHCKSISSTIDPIEDIGLEVTNTTSRSTSASLDTSFNTESTYSSSSSRRGSHNISPSPSSSQLLDVQRALEKFITMEKLDSGYKCESCGKVGQATKQSRLASIPPILTLHLKRFRYGGSGGDMMGGGGMGGKSYIAPAMPSRRRNNELASLLGNGYNSGVGSMIGDIGTSGSAKIEGHIEFKMIFDIRPYLTKELQSTVGKSMLCRLFAVVVHAGKNSHSGHYICYVRNVAKNEWWKMDDAKVIGVSTSEVLTAEAYMLFYRVMDHPVSVELRNREKAMKEAAAKAAKEEATRKAELEAMKLKQEEEAESIKMKEQYAHGNNSSNSNNGTSSISLLTNKRKREEPEFKSGDDWAKAVTNLPDTWMPFIRRIQDVLSDQFNFKAEYFRVLQDEVKAGGKLGAGPSVGIAADDIQGGINGIRSALKEMLKTILPEEKDILQQLLSSVRQLDGNEKDETMEDKNSLVGSGGNSDSGSGSGSGGEGVDGSMSSNTKAETNSSLIFPPVHDSNETML